MSLVLKQGTAIVSAGIAVGVVGAFVLRDAMTTRVFGVGTVDPFAYVTAWMVLAATTLAACAIPASRAVRLDPVVALRTE